jgi:trigger factor
MTDITVQKPKGLERAVQVSLSADEFSLAVSKKYSSVAGKISLPGFRKGKIPQHVIAQKYGNSIIGEVTQDLISSSLQKVLEEHKLNPVAMPAIDLKNNSVEKGLEYEAVFEEYPIIEVMDFAKAKLVIPTASITDSDIKEGIETVRKQNLAWNKTDKKSKKGNRVTVDFEGTINNVPFDGGAAKDFKVVLGEAQVLPEFDKALVGVVEGADVTAKVSFPKDYQKKELAGEKAEFKMKVTEVAVSSIPELDADFLKKTGIESGDVKDLEAEIKNTLALQMEKLLFSEKQKRVFALLEKNYKKTLAPKSLVKKELDHTISTLPKDEQDQYKDFTADSKGQIVTDAKNRIILSLVCQQIFRDWDIKLDQQKFEDYIKQISGTYVDNKQFMQWFYQDEKRVEQVKYTVLEQQMIDAIIAASSVKEEATSFKKLSETA